MTPSLDVLVVESHPGAADDAARTLTAAGHRVHRCHEPGDRGFPCRGVVCIRDCPMTGSIDVALLVRRHVTPRPTALEDGISCAIRKGVPIVEDGPDLLDPFDPYISRRLREGDDVAEACEHAAAIGLVPLAGQIVDAVGRLAAAGGFSSSAVSCRVVPNGSSIDVHLELPVETTPSFENALGVRVLDAIRSSGRTVGNVDVHVHQSPAPEASSLLAAQR